MDIYQFKSTLTGFEPPREWNVQLQALWYDAKGDWTTAHGLIDDLADLGSAHVHAYLHRVEGDLWNARYWYQRAGEVEFIGSLSAEREALILKF